ncbi:hypothetical protein COE91_03025 [Bacillus toyonensis]|nr:hypothetical protein COE91_03025 [Bacillus toyonensis]
MQLSKRNIELALIWFLFSLFCLQVSYVINTSTSILAGWSLSSISLISIFLFKEKLFRKANSKSIKIAFLLKTLRNSIIHNKCLYILFSVKI